MNSHPTPEFEISLDDEEGDRLIEKADALIQRHGNFAIAPDADDLPVLTDVVDERIEPFIGDIAPVLDRIDIEPALAEPPPAFATSVQPGDLAERLVALDTAISRHIEEWVASELPQLVSRELDDLAERLRTRAAAHLRATLIPLVSAAIADSLDPESTPDI